MEETYNVKAIILNRKNFSEDDSKIIIYSRDSGKLELVARGTKKIKSKLVGHIEPITLSNIMAVRGRQYDYAGAAASEQCYFNIKNDLDKLAAVGHAIRIFNKIIKVGQADEEIFELLKNFLDVLNRATADKISFELLSWLFIFKLLVKLGHKPELYYCVNCRAKILSAGMKFDLARGGLIGAECSAKIECPNGLTISENSVKLLRLAEKNDFNKLSKIKINNKGKEIKNIISLFLNYYV
ncbi:DNA repair protein RecO [Patescibacteria group bacterium]|nr:DNA repair protein RecO [Patescibacteria group bacterium]MBU1663122.1 DNA repair protein RecO [Patescibacteria group bacterium]MBU1933709.1 DNA repair protein RecO [Patescibacteria group bacterium]MBU2008021.1 DNA repair protein RecO [Patescibacteria group bacterium]MBU2233706.1 DNA repair protein RecO [Patescibacteria group bacterium]